MPSTRKPPAATTTITEEQPRQKHLPLQVPSDSPLGTLQPILKRLTVQISDIRIDGSTQVRVHGTDPATVERYADLWEEWGDECPLDPVKLMQDSDGTLWLFDGFHAREAAIRAGRTELFADIYEGTLDDARWQACFVQSQRGLTLSKEDLRNAMQQAILLNQSRPMPLSLRALARQLGVPFATVQYQFNKLAEKGTVTATREVMAQRGDRVYTFTRGEKQFTFEQLVELYKPLGQFVRSPSRFPYELERPGKSFYFRSLDDAFDQHFRLSQELRPVPSDQIQSDAPQPELAPLIIVPTVTAPTAHPAGVIASARSCERYTPEIIWQAGLNALGVDEFDLDPSSYEGSPIPCKKIFTKAENGLAQRWVADTLWSNFPYSDRDEDDKLQQVMGLWVAKLIESYQCGDVKQALTLVKSDCRTEWFHQLLEVSAGFCCIRKAVKHGIPAGDSAKQTASFFGSIVFYLGDNLDRFSAGYSPIGTICQSITK